NKSEIKDIIKLCVFTGVVTVLFGLYFSVFDDSVNINIHTPDLRADSNRPRGANVRRMPYFNIIFITDFFLAILFIVNVDKRIPHSLLLLGGIIIAILFDAYLGIFFTNILIIFAGVADKINISYLIYLILLGTLLCLMAPSIKNIRTIPPVLIIISSTQIILYILKDNFGLDENYLAKVLYEVLVTLIIVPSATLLFILYEYCRDKRMKKSPKIEGSKEYTLVEILLENFPLMEKLRENAPKMYEHALIVSEVAGQAAKDAGLNELLAKAGGMYHEIGKLEDNGYLKDGLQYAIEYHFPEDVINIIKSHNLKYAKPVSPEGAVVNLTISVLSAKDFLRRNLEETKHKDEADLNKLINKAIEEIFAMRLTKNSLDESGLTIKQFHDLKEFFLKL
ncbi:MAG: hypothetical protein K0S61_4886, partial [Anaerocolumna sp.]|nr:hypothetical protein [Anaerocolumna sp.]